MTSIYWWKYYHKLVFFSRLMILRIEVALQKSYRVSTSRKHPSIWLEAITRKLTFWVNLVSLLTSTNYSKVLVFHIKSEQWYVHCFLRKVLRLNNTLVMLLCMQLEKERCGLLREACWGEGECPSAQRREEWERRVMVLENPSSPFSNCMQHDVTTVLFSQKKFHRKT